MFRRISSSLLALWLAFAPALAANQSSVQTPSAGPMSATTFTSAYLNPALLAIFTCNWGPTAPANGPGNAPATHQCWADTSAAPVVKYKKYDGASWVIYGTLNTSTHTWTSAGGSGGGIQVRATLTSGAPVMQASVAAATTVYVTPYGGGSVPIYDGTSLVPTLFAETSQTVADTSRSPSAVAANSVYDIFCYTVPVLTGSRGPAWADVITRGYTLVNVNGVLLNPADIANGPLAQRGTYVATIASDASGTINFKWGGAGSAGNPAIFGIWNANRVNVGTSVIDNAASYTYTSSTIRQAHASLGAGMQVTFVVGLAEDAALVGYSNWLLLVAAAPNSFGRIGLGFDNPAAMDRRWNGANFTGGSGVTVSASLGGVSTWNVTVGKHVLYATEVSDNVNAHTFNFDGTVGSSGGLIFDFPM